MAGAQALNDDMAKAQADYQKIMNEGDSQAQMDAALAKASRDQTMYINVRGQFQSGNVGPQRQEPPAATGCACRISLAQQPGKRSRGPCDDSLGQWRANPDGAWKRVLHPDMAPTAAQVISISVTADPDRIAGIIGCDRRQEPGGESPELVSAEQCMQSSQHDPNVHHEWTSEFEFRAMRLTASWRRAHTMPTPIHKSIKNG